MAVSLPPFSGKCKSIMTGAIASLRPSNGALAAHFGIRTRPSTPHCNYHVANIVGSLFVGRGVTLFNQYLTFSHSSQEGVMYPVEFSAWPGHDLINMARKRKNVTRASV